MCTDSLEGIKTITVNLIGAIDKQSEIIIEQNEIIQNLFVKVLLLTVPFLIKPYGALVSSIVMYPRGNTICPFCV